ncbi:MAG TPA: ABC transporter ATP-binding protein [Anaerolineae bacterium]|nr:ABC transporter ATP-binding protein [Anaerolineae bacterium]
MTGNEIIVETHDLRKIYGDGEEIRALDGVNLTVKRGEFLSVMGPSGSGKSTLLYVLGALARPTHGQILIDGQELTKVKDLDRFRNETIGFIFQLHNLIPTMTALENVEVPLHEQKVSGKERRRRSREVLELVGLGDRLTHLPNQMSGGQCQRVAVARSLVNQPSLVLADEPTGELDTVSSKETIDLMHDMNRRLGTTFIIVTHDPAVARRTERILIMGDGRIVREDIITDPYAEDLRMLRHSPLGRAVLEGREDLAVDGVALFRGGEPTEAGRLLRELLEQV